MVRAGTGVVLLVLFVAFVTTQVGNSGLSSGITEYVDATQIFANDLFDTVEEAADKLVSLSERAESIADIEFDADDLESAIENGLADAKNITDSFDQVSASVESYNAQRETIQQVASILSLVLVGIALIGGLILI